MVKLIIVISVALTAGGTALAREKGQQATKTLEQNQAEFAADKKCAADDRAKRIEIYTATLQCINGAEDWLGLSACQREESEKLVSSIVKCKSSAKNSKKH